MSSIEHHPPGGVVIVVSLRVRLSEADRVLGTLSVMSFCIFVEP